MKLVCKRLKNGSPSCGCHGHTMFQSGPADHIHNPQLPAIYRQWCDPASTRLIQMKHDNCKNCSLCSRGAQYHTRKDHRRHTSTRVLELTIRQLLHSLQSKGHTVQAKASALPGTCNRKPCSIQGWSWAHFEQRLQLHVFLGMVGHFPGEA